MERCTFAYCRATIRCDSDRFAQLKNADTVFKTPIPILTTPTATLTALASDSTDPAAADTKPLTVENTITGRVI